MHTRPLATDNGHHLHRKKEQAKSPALTKAKIQPWYRNADAFGQASWGYTFGNGWSGVTNTARLVGLRDG